MKIKRKEGIRVVKVEHNKKLLWVIGFLVLVLIVVVIVLRQEITKRNALVLNDTQIANPASVYCTSQGGKLELINNESGSWGLCTLASGIVCEEWALFRGECEGVPGALVDEDSCIVDADCVKVQTGCCPCSMGGEEICINKENVGLYDFSDKCSDRTICPAVYSCKENSCSCVNGKCVF
jgi:putative hemolysin